MTWILSTGLRASSSCSATGLASPKAHPCCSRSKALRKTRTGNSRSSPQDAIPYSEPHIWSSPRSTLLWQSSQPRITQRQSQTTLHRPQRRAILTVPTLPRKRQASSPEAMPSTPSTARRSPSGSPTMYSSHMEPAPSWQSRHTTPVTGSSPRSSTCRSLRSSNQRSMSKSRHGQKTESTSTAVSWTD